MRQRRESRRGTPLHHCNVSEGDRPGDVDLGTGRVTEAASRTDVSVQIIVFLGRDGLSS